MNSARTLVILLAAALLTFSATSLWADDWKTTDGKVYQNVTVLAARPDAVMILHQDGGALVPLANLPADLQKRFNYDPVKAKAAAEALIKENAANAVALQAEMNQTGQMRQAGSEVNSSPENNVDAISTMPASTNGAHYSIAGLSDSIHSLSHDLSDPTYHTMANLGASTHSLGPDPSDSTHHTMGEIGGL